MNIRYTIAVSVISVFASWLNIVNAQSARFETIELIPYFSGHETERPYEEPQQYGEQSPYQSFRSPNEPRSSGIGPDHHCGNGECNHGPSSSRVENNYRGDNYAQQRSRRPQGPSSYASGYGGSRNFAPPVPSRQRGHENYNQGYDRPNFDAPNWQRSGYANDRQPNRNQPSAADLRPELRRQPFAEPRFDQPQQTYSSYQNYPPRNAAPNQQPSGSFPAPAISSHDHSQCNHDH